MNFMTALELMDEGKKVRRKAWPAGLFIYIDRTNNNRIFSKKIFNGKQESARITWYPVSHDFHATDYCTI